MALGATFYARILLETLYWYVFYAMDWLWFDTGLLQVVYEPEDIVLFKKFGPLARFP